jgi:hypothetical protein
VHENHLFLAAILSAVLFWEDGRYLSTFVIWSLASNVNLIVFYGISGTGLSFSRVIGVDVALLFSILNMLLFAASFSATLRDGWVCAALARYVKLARGHSMQAQDV